VTAPVIELVGPAVGGIRAHVIELTRRLRRDDVEVVVAGPRGVLGTEVGVDVDVDVPRGASPTGLLRARRQLATALADSGAEVVHAHGLKAGWVAVTSRPRPRVVLTAHNVVLPGAGLKTRALAVLERALVRRVDELISPSPDIDRRFADLLPDDRRRVILPVSPPATEPRPRDTVRAEMAVPTDAPLVVVAARLHPQKDLATFVRAMERVARGRPDVVARIVGEGPARGELAGQIAVAGLGDVVKLVGASPRAVDQMAAADVVALSSTWEAVPLVVVEAMALGRPVVTTRVGIVDQLIETGKTGWVVEVGDHVALGDALLDALADPARLATVGAAARVAARALSDPDTLVSAVRDVYRSASARLSA
jgi:glycosyltransferase involved in cell wall biosynthesis